MDVARIPTAKAMCFVFKSEMELFGDMSSYPRNFWLMVKCVAKGASTHADLRMRQLSLFLMCSITMAQPCFSIPEWDWEVSPRSQSSLPVCSEIGKLDNPAHKPAVG